MRKNTHLFKVVVAAGMLVVSPSFACGDKLAALGGGVPFNRIQPFAHPGNVILYLKPESRFAGANADIGLDRALTRAGHTVRVVASRSDLDRALSEAEADVVLMDFADAKALDARLSDRVPTLSVSYGEGAGATLKVSPSNQCFIEADKHRAVRLVRAVNSIIEGRESGHPIECAKIGGRGSS